MQNKCPIKKISRKIKTQQENFLKKYALVNGEIVLKKCDDKRKIKRTMKTNYRKHLLIGYI